MNHEFTGSTLHSLTHNVSRLSHVAPPSLYKSTLASGTLPAVNIAGKGPRQKIEDNLSFVKMWLKGNPCFFHSNLISHRNQCSHFYVKPKKNYSVMSTELKQSID